MAEKVKNCALLAVFRKLHFRKMKKMLIDGGMVQIYKKIVNSSDLLTETQKNSPGRNVINFSQLP